MIDRATSGATFDVVSVKGLGDLVIALTCLQRVLPQARSRFRFLLGQHLETLWAALAPPFAATVVTHPDTGAAALFQVNSRPIPDIARSAWGLRRSLRHARHRANVMLFDEIDIRHRFLSFGATALALPRRDNLYRQWNGFIEDHGVAGPATDAPPVVRGKRLHIFPGAREQERRFPLALLRDLVDRATAAGLTPSIFTVAGEMAHLTDTDLPLVELPRDFARTIAAVSSADRIVSADSMTAHLAEYHAKPIHVLAPVEKYYWLPLSAARAGRHALFADGADHPTLQAFFS